MQMDIRWVNWADPRTLVPLHDFCQFQHLLHLSGCSWSSRLKYLMLCRATIVFPSSPYLEFWYRALTPGKNVLIAPEMVALDGGMQLVKIAQRLIKDEPLALRCAEELTASTKLLLLLEGLSRLCLLYAGSRLHVTEGSQAATSTRECFKHTLLGISRSAGGITVATIGTRSCILHLTFSQVGCRSTGNSAPHIVPGKCEGILAKAIAHVQLAHVF